MAELLIESASLTDPGRTRGHNEDAVGLWEPSQPDLLAGSGRLYLVADGVGGAAAGELASDYAVRKVLYEYYRWIEADPADRLNAAAGAVNADLFAHLQRHPELHKFGTTLVAAAIRGDELVVCSVGDSRAYLVRDGQIRQITRDHSLVAQLLEEGTITPDEARRHPRRNVLLRCLGADKNVYPDLFRQRLRPDDRLVLCSDGLTRDVAEGEILRVVQRRPPGQAASYLLAMANRRGGEDNISLIVLHVVGPAPRGAASGADGTPGIPDEPHLEALAARQERPQKPTRPWRRWAWTILGLGLIVAGLAGGGLLALWLWNRALLPGVLAELQRWAGTPLEPRQWIALGTGVLLVIVLAVLLFRRPAHDRPDRS